MKIPRVIFLLLSILAGGLALGDVAYAAPVADSLSIEVSPTELIPAQAGMVYVSGRHPLAVSVRLDDAPLEVFWTGDGYAALYAFGRDEPPGEHALAVEAADPVTGERQSYETTITVVAFTFTREYVQVPYRLVPLFDPELNQAETDRLAEIFANVTYPEKWEWPYLLPVPGGIVTSRFGNDRSYNGGQWYGYHTGTDFRRASGEPVQATAGGTVVLAEYLEVRGNVVIVDHGHGVFSLYGHLSEPLVAAGETVQQGQTIGLAGATGRSGGPHLHFEIIVNGINVDPIRWLGLKPGFVPPAELPAQQAEAAGTSSGE
jgi:murein DD-endopeptidase MepM/ murein hydrolase activator NlpD